MNDSKNQTSFEIKQVISQPYKYGFQTKIETETFPPGINENIVELISTKKELVDQIASTGDVTKVVAKDILEGIIDSMADELDRGGEVVLKKFGRFYLKNRPARKGRNPRTGTEINIPAKTVVKFAPRGLLK